MTQNDSNLGFKVMALFKVNNLKTEHIILTNSS